MCTDGINSYTCNCSTGYTGSDCETDIDDCQPDLCQNGGTCNDLVNGYNCACPACFMGDNCELSDNSCVCPGKFIYVPQMRLYTYMNCMNCIMHKLVNNNWMYCYTCKLDRTSYLAKLHL